MQPTKAGEGGCHPIEQKSLAGDPGCAPTEKERLTENTTA
jgi:hypothetical protein